MNILVTGAAGFIASHVVDRLVDHGHTVTGIDNLNTGSMGNVNPNIKFINGDVSGCALPKADVIFHAAATYDDPTAYRRDLETNAIGTARVAAHAKKTGARVVYLQTSLCYGLRPPPYPMSEDQPLNPQGSYAVSKTTGELYLRDIMDDWCVFRLANIYGPRNLSGPIPTFWKKITGGETCNVADTRRDFVYVQDAVNIFVRAIEGKQTGVFHVSTGADYPISEVFSEVAANIEGEIIFNEVERKHDDVITILLDPSKAETAFMWKASTPLSEGIRNACLWYEAHPPKETFTHLVGAK